MRQRTLVLAMILVVPAGGALAQPVAEPTSLMLPMGARVRLQTMAAPGSWVKGVLVGADATGVAIIPEDAPPLGANQLRLPSASVGRFELKTGSKRHWLPGLIAGVAVGLVAGFTADVNAEACDTTSYFGSSSDLYYCSRGEAVAVSTAAFGAIGAGIGALIKTDRWTPVALDALAPPPARISGVAPQLRVLPSGGVALGLAVGF